MNTDRVAMEEALVGVFDCRPGISPEEKLLSTVPNPNYKEEGTPAFEDDNLKNLRLISAVADGHAVMECVVTEALCNRRKLLHGAAGCLIFENATIASMMLIARPGFWAVQNAKNPQAAHFAAVTRSLSTTWMRPAPLGTTVRITAEVVHVGARNALVKAEMVDKGSGKLVAVAQHEMVNLAESLLLVQKIAQVQQQQQQQQQRGSGAKL
ncbi:HotDog domain-containing protein [Sphaerosporella brunnea]|uniref:HotDog domain-containing protein n=1 Tax=Sphaerosporella brunnea TaxID=1250544 RepID=A0A5J5EYJ8_9PEZI|nr:HotDog domain-containing protein [Sphaerosporella brunnea]KAA8908100.1 HotDog domain-containing protein [Sphaerosporella brunnea]